MKFLFVLAAAMLLTVAVPTHSAELPVDTVRVVAVGDTKMCSAVVIAPGLAMTARHCLKRGITVDSVAIAYVTAAGPANEDIATLHAPDLKCPCAVLGKRPAIGAKVIAVGFPGELKGKRRATAETAVLHVSVPTVLAPWAKQPGYADQVYILTAPVIQMGDSGGGLFTVQDGVWKVVGINAIGVPASPIPFDDEEQASGFVPVDIANKFLPKL